MVGDLKDQSGASKKSQKSLDSVSYFPSFFTSDHHQYAARKAERLASAVHVVTGFMGPTEPLRAMLRTGALEVVQLTTDLARLGALGPDGFGTKCAEIGSLLETAQAANLVSPMNAKLIIEEYAGLATFVKDRFSVLREQVKNLSDMPPPPVSFSNIKDKLHIRQNAVGTQKDTSVNSTSMRRDEILSLFNTKDRISIKDAVSFIGNVSEKTIQRDLLSMVQDGLLIKEGERRWSTYRKAFPVAKVGIQSGV